MKARVKSIKVTPAQFDENHTRKKYKTATFHFDVEMPMGDEDTSTEVYAVQELLDEELVDLVVLPLQLRFKEEGGEKNEEEAETDSTESNGRHAGDVSESEAHPIG